MNGEAKVKANIKKMLAGYPGDVWWFMPPANGFGKAGVPDFIGGCGGKLFAIEAKFGSGKQTPWQLRHEAAIRAAGCKFWLIDDKNLLASLNELALWFAEVKCS